MNRFAYNLNRKNNDLRFFEFGKTYHSSAPGKYEEDEHLCLYITGNRSGLSWKTKPAPSDIYYLKGVAEAILNLLGVNNYIWETSSNPKT